MNRQTFTFTAGTESGTAPSYLTPPVRDADQQELAAVGGRNQVFVALHSVLERLRDFAIAPHVGRK